MTSPQSARDLLAAADPAATLTLDAELDDLRGIPALGAGGSHVADVADLGAHRRRRVGRRAGVAIGLAALTAVGGTAAAVTLMREPKPEVIGIACRQAASELLVDPAGQTPIDRCSRAWREQGQTVPTDLVAYREQGRVLTVAPRALVPSDATLVDGRARSDVRLLELQHAIIDDFHGVGPEANPGCLTQDAARTFVDSTLTRLGLSGRVAVTAPDGTGECTTASLDAQSGRVRLDARTRADVGRPMFATEHPVPAASDAGPEQIAEIKAENADVRFRAAVAAIRARRGSVADYRAAIRTWEKDRGTKALTVDVIPSPVQDAPRMYQEVNNFHIYAPDQQ